MALDPREFIRLHAGMPEHPKVDPLSDAAFRCLIEAWCLCRRTRNDGRIPLATWRKKWKPKPRKELVDAGLVELEKDAAVMRDWLQHQPSVEELDRKRSARIEAGRKGGVRSGESRRGSSKPRTNSEANASASASPELEPELEQTPNENEPELEIEKEIDSGAVRGVSYVSTARDDRPPPPHCPDHPGGTPDPCRACGDARKRWIQANLEREEREAEEAQRFAEQRAEDVRRRNEDRARATANCGLCDERGYVGMVLCDHDPETAERARRGLARARIAACRMCDADGLRADGSECDHKPPRRAESPRAAPSSARDAPSPPESTPQPDPTPTEESHAHA